MLIQKAILSQHQLTILLILFQEKCNTLCKKRLANSTYSVILLDLPEIFYKKHVLKNFVKFTESNCNEALFLVKLQAWATLLKKDSIEGVFL